MTIRTDAAPVAIQSALTDAERHQLLARANYPHLQEEPGAYLVKITEEMVRAKLLAAMAQENAHAVPPSQWLTTVAQMKVLGEELSRAAEVMGGDDEESRDVELILAVAPAGTVQDDDDAVNDAPILTVRLAEYPEEGVYPVDPHDPTGGRIDTPSTPASAQGDAQTLAVRDVLAERQRQISVEGWTPQHDDAHSGEQMALAAACYALPQGEYDIPEPPQFWPWAPHWWKPGERRRELVKAGALILAEVERLDRAAIAAPQAKDGA